MAGNQPSGLPSGQTFTTLGAGVSDVFSGFGELTQAQGAEADARFLPLRDRRCVGLSSCFIRNSVD